MNIELQRARKRQMFIFLLVCFGMIALLGRAYYWQVINPVVLDGYTTRQLANFEHVKNRVLDAPRAGVRDHAARERLAAGGQVAGDAAGGVAAHHDPVPT